MRCSNFYKSPVIHDKFKDIGFYPEGGIVGKFDILIGIEFLDRLHQTDITFLDKIQEILHPNPLKFQSNFYHQPKIRCHQGQRKLFFKLKKEKQKLIDMGFDPKPKLLSERLGVSEREVVDMDQRLDGWDVSLDAPLKDDSDTERIEFLSTSTESIEEQVSKKEIEVLLHNKIAEFRKKMTPRELEIFDLRIFSDNPVTLQEIGDRYGISRERVRQVEKNIIKKMREFFKREIPDFASYTEGNTSE